MEFNFSELRQKDVINVTDGKNLGKVCDMRISFPENNVLGLTVTGSKGFKFSKQEVFLPINCVTKIGKDAILVNFGGDDKPKPPKPDCNPCPPPCPPQCPPPCPPPNRPRDKCMDRRSLDEYE